MATPESDTCPADVSTGLPHADVIMAFDDASVDLVNINQVNGSTRSTSRWGPHVSGTVSLTSWSRVSVGSKNKRKRLKGATGLKEVRAGLGWTIGSARDGAGRLGSSGWTARWTGLASPFLLLLFSLMAQRIGPEAAQLLLHLFLFLFSSFLLWLTSWSRRSASPSSFG